MCSLIYKQVSNFHCVCAICFSAEKTEDGQSVEEAVDNEEPEK